MISNQSKWQRYRTSLLKARSLLDQATLRYAFENRENPDCGYIITNNETSHTNNTDCSSLYDFYKKALNVVKVCESNAYENGCIPEYEGIDNNYKKNNPSISDDDVIEAIEDKNKDFFLGVQWHPETMITYDKLQQELFNYFVNICRRPV